MKKWIEPHVDTSTWEYYDLSCVSRDNTEDQVLHDAVAAGARVGSIFKEPTVTPTEVQKNALGLKKAWGSPNGAMRRGWNGITISRDTIHIEGMELGYKRPVLFERHAVGGEYGAGWKEVGAGLMRTAFYPAGGGDRIVIDERTLPDKKNAVVAYHNPLDNVPDLAHHFFKRCLEAQVTPYVVTKKTVFKWQEGFWQAMKSVFDEHYHAQFLEAGLLERCGGQLPHLISDAATMQIIRWTDGGFGMAAHNYDGDMLTDEVAQVRSPAWSPRGLLSLPPHLSPSLSLPPFLPRPSLALSLSLPPFLSRPSPALSLSLPPFLSCHSLALSTTCSRVARAGCVAGPPLARLHHLQPDRQAGRRHHDQRVRGLSRDSR